jgi:hypothetical protein
MPFSLAEQRTLLCSTSLIFPSTHSATSPLALTGGEDTITELQYGTVLSTTDQHQAENNALFPQALLNDAEPSSAPAPGLVLTNASDETKLSIYEQSSALNEIIDEVNSLIDSNKPCS